MHMRRFLTLFTMLMLCGVLAFAQSRVVTGKVTDSDGNPVSFASIKIKGTLTGLSADANGSYSIKVKSGDVLVISGASFKTIEVPVGSQSLISTVLEKSTAGDLKEVVVTSAFQTKRTQRSMTSNAQVVTGEAVNTIRQTNINNALAGKVAGLQVRSQSSAALDGGASIRLNGESGLSSGSVLYIVDGTQMPNANDISADDVEDYTVLQGPAAAALYGPAGQNGVVIITLKKAKRNSGIGLEVNTGIQFDKLYILPNYQNSYSGGSTPDMIKYTYKAGDPIGWKALDGKYYPNYEDDASWGPRMAGQEYIPWYAWYPGSEYSYKTAKLTPQPTNSADFFNTGVTKNTNVSFSKAGDDYNIRASYSNLDVQGIIPTTTLKRNMLTVNASLDLNSHFTFSTNINYISQNTNGVFNQGYSNQTTGSFNSWYHRDLDMGIMRELRYLTNSDGTLASWNHQNILPGSDPSKALLGNYWYNFYSYLDNKLNYNHRDRLYGNMALTYKINNDLSVKLTYRKAQNTTYNEAITTTLLEKSATQTGEKASYGTVQTNWNKQNIEGLLSYNKKLKNLSIGFNAGFDIFSEIYRQVAANTNGGLTIDNLYTLGNSKNPASYSSQLIQDKYKAIFASAVIGFRNFLFIDGTARQDYFSTLPPADNGIFSKSAGISFVFSDLIKKSIPFLSYGKLKASWGEVPGSLGAYDAFYGAYAYPGSLYGVNANQWNGNILSTTPNGLTDPAIHGAVAVQKDFGLEMSFLKNRVGFTVLYKLKTTKDFPYAVGITGTSGITTKTVNTGEIDQKSLDATLNLKPIWAKNLQVDINATFSKNISNKVVSIAPGITSFTLGGGAGASFSGIPTPVVKLGVDLPWGSIIGGGYKYAPNGKPLLDASGLYINDPAVNFGSVLPDYTGGVQTSITFFKNFVANINIDYQVGGKFFSLSDMWGSFSGLTARTAVLNDRGKPIRDPVADGGGVHVFGVDQTSGKDVDYYIGAKDYFAGLVNRNVFNEFIYDLTFVKLREFSLGYKVPVEKLGVGRYLKNATFSITARNPWLIYAKTKDFDPSEITAVYGENGQYPGTRSLGFNLKLGF